jgi:hypothetical protein
VGWVPKICDAVNLANLADAAPIWQAGRADKVSNGSVNPGMFTPPASAVARTGPGVRVGRIEIDLTPEIRLAGQHGVDLDKLRDV